MSIKQNTPTDKELEQFGRELWSIYETNYKNRKRAYWFIFVKGLIYGFGLFLGGTILVALLLWSLSFFEDVPLLSPVVEKLNQVIIDPTTPVK